MAFFEFLTFPGPNQAKMGCNCADDVPARGVRACSRARPVQKHHQHNCEPILAQLGPGGVKSSRKAIKVRRRQGRPLPLGLKSGRAAVVQGGVRV